MKNYAFQTRLTVLCRLVYVLASDVYVRNIDRAVK